MDMLVWLWPVINLVGIGFCLWGLGNRPSTGVAAIMWFLLVFQILLFVVNVHSAVTTSS